MPQLQWLGDIEKETGGGYLAKALGGGISTGLQTYVGTREKRIEQAEEKRKALASEEMDKKKLELMQQQSDADVIKDMTDTMKRIPIDKQSQAWLLMKDFFKARGRPMDTVIDQLSQIPITPDTDLEAGIFRSVFGETTTTFPSVSAAPSPTGPLNPLRVLPGYAHYGKSEEGKRRAYNALRVKGISMEEAKRRAGIK